MTSRTHLRSQFRRVGAHSRTATRRLVHCGAAWATGALLGTTAAGQPAEPTPARRVPESPSVERKAEEVSPLVPEGEPAMMRGRDVEKVGFKPGKGLGVESADGDFGLNLAFYVQFLTTYLDDHAADRDTLGLQIRRARVGLSGNTFGKHNRYKIELAFSPDDVKTKDGTVTTSPLLDAYAEFDHLRDLTLRVGQYKVPFSYQRLYADSSLQLVDTSINTQEFNLDRDVGVDLRSRDFLGLGYCRYYVGIFSGDGRNGFEGDEIDLLYVGRLELMPLGAFEDPGEQDFERGKLRVLLGGAYAHFTGAKRAQGGRGTAPADEGTTDIDTATGDLTVRAAGLSLRGDMFWRKGNRNPGPAEGTPSDPTDPTSAPIGVTPSSDGLGWGVQAGYLLPRIPLEVAARFARMEGKTVADHDGLKHKREVGGGVSYYFARNSMKLQADWFRIFAPDPGFVDGTDQVRLQLQVGY